MSESLPHAAPSPSGQEPAPACGAASGSTGRVGAVDLEDIALIEAPRLDESPDFQQMTDRLLTSEAVVESLQKRGAIQLDLLLTQTLDRLATEGGLDGMLIGSDEGFVVASSARIDRAEILAAVTTLLADTVQRAQREGFVGSVEELTLRGTAGEQVVLRYFPGLGQRLFLIACAREGASYRRTTNRALKACGDLLARSMGVAQRPATRSRRPRHPQPSPEPPSDPGPSMPAAGPTQISPAEGGGGLKTTESTEPERAHDHGQSHQT